MAANFTRKSIEDFRKQGIRKIELDENLNLYIISESEVSHSDAFKKFKDGDSESLCSRFYDDVVKQFDSICGVHSESEREGLKIWSWDI